MNLAEFQIRIVKRIVDFFRTVQRLVQMTQQRFFGFGEHVLFLPPQLGHLILILGQSRLALYQLGKVRIVNGCQFWLNKGQLSFNRRRGIDDLTIKRDCRRIRRITVSPQHAIDKFAFQFFANRFVFVEIS